MKWLYITFLAALLSFWFFGCAPKRFDWNNYCSLRKECPEDKWCDIGTGPDGEPFEYGQCVKYED